MNKEEEILEKLKKSILEFEAEDARLWATKAMEEGADPKKTANVITEAIRQVGAAFGLGDIFLPELISAADAAKQAMPVISEALKKSGKKREVVGTIAIGTVAGDIHDIGKTIVAALFEAAGFEVIDLGIDISKEKFIEAVKEHKPDILGMSALLTTTAKEQGVVIESLKDAGIRDNVKIIVGGGAINQALADQIGADGYGATAAEGVELGLRLMTGKQ